METNKYLHYRHFDKDGKPEPKRGATVAYRIYPDRSLRFAVAAVHHNDNFSREIGRNIADLRLTDPDRQAFYCPVGKGDELQTMLEFREYMDGVMYRARGYKRRRKPRYGITVIPVAIP